MQAEVGCQVHKFYTPMLMILSLRISGVGEVGKIYQYSIEFYQAYHSGIVALVAPSICLVPS